mgnify:CR=1 FL=1
MHTKHTMEDALLCANCGHKESKVIDSRSFEDGSSIKRRRECLSCGYRFTTYERREEIPVMIEKKDGSIEPFDRSKLLRSLLTATAKRDIPLSSLQELVESLENDLRYQYKAPIPSKVLGDQVLIRLRSMDKVAYVRFASVYKDFKDLGEFNEELLKLASEADAAHTGVE